MPKGSTRKEVFFLRFTSPHERGTDMYPSLDAARTAAWDMRREGKLRPVEILDWHMQPVMSRQELRAYLDLQDREWPEIEDLGESLNLDD